MPAGRLALAVLRVGPASAQTSLVAGSLVDAETSGPVQGAAVFLMDEGGSAVDVLLSDAAGEFRLRAPRPGAYRLRVERIGFETEGSEAFTVEASEVRRISMRLRVRPIELDPIPVRAERVCDVDLRSSRDLVRVWGTWRLSEIAFRFSGSAVLDRARHQGGAIVLEMDEAGGWYVSRWHLRRPITERGRLTFAPNVRGRIGTRRLEVTGYAERAGRVLRVDRRSGG